MKKIKLTKGKEALVDACDYDFLMKWKWYANGFSTDNFYACRRGKSRKATYMHRVIAQRKGLSMSHVIDHSDANSLNNQRYNLRSATFAQNGQNRQLGKNSTSGVKGVSWSKKDKAWQVRIQVQKKRKAFGNFQNKEEASKVSKEMYKKLHKEFAHI